MYVCNACMYVMYACMYVCMCMYIRMDECIYVGLQCIVMHFKVM